MVLMLPRCNDDKLYTIIKRFSTNKDEFIVKMCKETYCDFHVCSKYDQTSGKLTVITIFKHALENNNTVCSILIVLSSSVFKHNIIAIIFHINENQNSLSEYLSPNIECAVWPTENCLSSQKKNSSVYYTSPPFSEKSFNGSIDKGLKDSKTITKVHQTFAFHKETRSCYVNISEIQTIEKCSRKVIKSAGSEYFTTNFKNKVITKENNLSDTSVTNLRRPVVIRSSLIEYKLRLLLNYLIRNFMQLWHRLYIQDPPITKPPVKEAAESKLAVRNKAKDTAATHTIGRYHRWLPSTSSRCSLVLLLLLQLILADAASVNTSVLPATTPHFGNCEY